VDVHRGEEAGGLGDGNKNNVFVDVINGWPMDGLWTLGLIDLCLSLHVYMFLIACMPLQGNTI